MTAPSAPLHRGRPLARREHLATMQADITERGADLVVRFRMSHETWLWTSRGGGWFEESTLLASAMSTPAPSTAQLPASDSMSTPMSSEESPCPSAPSTAR